MRLLILLAGFCIFMMSANAQILTVSDFVDITSLSRHKFEAYISKKGFANMGMNYADDGPSYDYFFKRKLAAGPGPSDSATRFLTNCVFNKEVSFKYRTSSPSENEAILRQLKEKGFSSGKDNNTFSLLFQKGDMTIRSSRELEDTVLYYNFLVDKKILPALRDIKFGEDLLDFDSHENLVYTFGVTNVRSDVYYFSAHEAQKCSVLYPNSPRQAIFIWEDQANNRKLSHILIGGSLRAESSLDFNLAIPQNTWMLGNGLHVGMSLSELKSLNGDDFVFFGYDSEYPGIVVPSSRGYIDFRRTGVMLSCMNCTGSDLVSRDMINAQQAIDLQIRMFVQALILLPDDSGIHYSVRK